MDVKKQGLREDALAASYNITDHILSQILSEGTQAATQSVDGYMNLIRQLTAYIFKARKEKRAIDEVSEATALACESQKACARDVGSVQEVTVTHLAGDGNQNLQQAVLQEQAAVLQKRIDKQIHTNASLKGQIACIQKQISQHGELCQTLLRRQQTIATTATDVSANIDLELRATRMLRSSNCVIHQCIADWKAVSRMATYRNRKADASVHFHNVGVPCIPDMIPNPKAAIEGEGCHQALMTFMNLLHSHYEILTLFSKANSLNSQLDQL